MLGPKHKNIISIMYELGHKLIQGNIQFNHRVYRQKNPEECTKNYDFIQEYHILISYFFSPNLNRSVLVDTGSHYPQITALCLISLMSVCLRIMSVCVLCLYYVCMGIVFEKSGKIVNRVQPSSQKFLNPPLMWLPV